MLTVILTYPTCVWRPRGLWIQKTRIPGLSCRIICVRLAVLIQYQSDRHTQTHDDGIYHASIALRGEKKSISETV